MTTSNDSTTPLKRCTKCGVEHHATSEYFNKSKLGKYGLRAKCKVCQREYQRHRRNENIEQHREYDRAWRLQNKERLAQRRKELYHANPEPRRESSRKHRKNNPEKARAAVRRYQNTYPERVRVSKLRHYANKTSGTATFTEEQWLNCLNYWHGCCAYCGNQRDFWNVIEQDHVIPVTAGGAYIATNIIPACRSCNSSKNNTELMTWLMSRFGQRRAKQMRHQIDEYFNTL